MYLARINEFKTPDEQVLLDAILSQDTVPCFECAAPGKARRQNTTYAHDPSNWVISCDRCFEQSEKEWADRWYEFYSGLL